jgi:hypothetical protein
VGGGSTPDLHYALPPRWNLSAGPPLLFCDTVLDNEEIPMTGKTRPTSRRVASSVASVLAADAALHVYWTTGARWPAGSTRELSNAVLGFVVPFTPPVLLPLVAILLFAAALLLFRGFLGREHRLGRLSQLATMALAGGFVLRGLLGIVWVFGIGMDAGRPFFWLNIFLYTPLCIALGIATGWLSVQDAPGRMRLRHPTAALDDAGRSTSPMQEFLRGR